jgi:glutaredoxin
MFQAVQNGSGKAAPVTVYWRPGCPFCSRLRGNLRAMGLAPREVNIWADPSAAATVRSLAGGNETVPTVVIGERGYVNPTAAEVLAEVRRAVPGFAADENIMRAARRQRRRLRAVQWLVIGALVAAGFALEGTGHAALSWAADGAAVAVYLLFRLARRL